MRATVLAACTLTTGLLPMMAQDPTPQAPAAGPRLPGGQGGYRDPAQMEARQLERMTERLKLTPDQVMQVKAIEDNQRTQMTALRQDNSLQPEDRHARVTALRQENEGKVRDVLTDEQKPKYDAMLARQQEHMGHRPDGAGGPPPAPAAPPQ